MGRKLYRGSAHKTKSARYKAAHNAMKRGAVSRSLVR